jgi:hypothetical protein
LLAAYDQAPARQRSLAIDVREKQMSALGHKRTYRHLHSITSARASNVGDELLCRKQAKSA